MSHQTPPCYVGESDGQVQVHVLNGILRYWRAFGAPAVAHGSARMASLSRGVPPAGAREAPRARWPAAADGRRRVLIHAGLHKTGTTSIQHVLSSATECLREQGILYPKSGRPAQYPTGHHTVAWELAGDRRFAASCGTLDDVASEIAAFPGDAILSSEDFESVLAAPQRLCPLLGHRLLENHAFTLVFWVRDQASYIESLFVQMLAYRMAEEAARICELAIANGQLRHEDWTFHFDYEAAAAGLHSLPLNLIVRPYGRLGCGSSVNDFLAFANIVLPAREALNQQMNMRPDLADALAAFYENRSGIELDWHGPLRHGIGQSIGGHSAHLSRQMRSVLAKRFSPGNNRLARRHGFPSEALGISLMPADAIHFEQLFSSRTETLLRDLAGTHANADRIAAAIRAECGFASHAGSLRGAAG